MTRARQISVLFDEKKIADRVQALAYELAERKPENLLVIAVLKGSFMFAADLMRALHHAKLEPQVEFVHLASYYEGTESSGQVKILKDVAMALMMAAARRLPEGMRVIPDDKWSGWSPTWMLGQRITGKSLGIVGMGRIGQAVARRARAFGLEINYHNRKRLPAEVEKNLQATYWESLDQMLLRMDIVSIHCPHTPATFHLLSARRLKLLRPDAILVNTARGEVIDETALIRMLETGEIARVALDVFEHEPSVNPRLVDLAKAGKIVLLPHMCSATIEGRADMGERVIANIQTFVDGHRPPDRVLPSML